MPQLKILYAATKIWCSQTNLKNKKSLAEGPRGINGYGILDLLQQILLVCHGILRLF